MSDIAAYVNVPDCSCGHPQTTHYHPGMVAYCDELPGCRECDTCNCYDGVIETLGVGRSPDKLHPAKYDQ